MNTSIEQMSVQELKSLAYDQLVLFEQAQKNLQLLNGEIAKRNKIEIPEEVKKEDIHTD